MMRGTLLSFRCIAALAFLGTGSRAGEPPRQDNAPAPAPAPHWAFQPIQRLEPPPAAAGRAGSGSWAEHPVDRFVAAGLEANGLVPRPTADRRVLLRRVYFDLLGLPPAPDEAARFLSDDEPDAFDRLVDRLLASPRYGERWGRHWLDVARYADTAGDNADYPVPEARLYRDYVIDSFNADKPYDRFVTEQLAGDLLARDAPPDRYAELVTATGFLALSRRYGTSPGELWHLTLEDTIETTGRAFLGLTLRCARCHDHKFDPITQGDYYALYGIFASTRFPYAGSEEFQSKSRPRADFAPLAPPDAAAPLLEAHRKKIETLEAELRGAPKEKAAPLEGALRGLKRWGAPPDLPIAYAVAEGKPQDVLLQARGEPDGKGPPVPRGLPRFLAGQPGAPWPPGSPWPAGESGRRELARWIASPDNPLTARVMANRVWQHHFGKGLVTTPSSFGRRGAEPSHPRLLDWLASRLIESGWSVKALHRIILTSKTYRLASDGDVESERRDPGNRWYWRHDRRRLDAEAIRDAMLCASGSLELSRPGLHPFPPITQWGWTQHSPFKAVYPSNGRSVYLMTQRLQRHPYLALFDGPDPNTTTEARTSATVPLQALYLLNNPFVDQESRALARRLRSGAADPRSRIAGAYEIVWCRPPTAEESQQALEYVVRYAETARAEGLVAEEADAEAWASYARLLLTANEFVYID